MDPVDEQELRQHRVDIVKTLEPGDVIHNLYEKGVISEGEYSTLSSSSSQTRKERCQSLMEILPRRGPEAFPAFIFSLQENGYPSLAAKLRLKTDSDYTPYRRNCKKPCETCQSYLPNVSGLRTNFVTLLIQNCCLWLQIDPVDFLDDYYQEGIFGETECQFIRAGITRLAKCKLFFQELCHRQSDKILKVFQKALKRQRKYNFIYEALKESVEVIINSQAKVKSKPSVATDQIIEPYQKLHPQEDGEGDTVNPRIKYNGRSTRKRVRRSRLRNDRKENGSFTRSSFIRKRPYGNGFRRIKENKIHKRFIYGHACSERKGFYPLLLNPDWLSLEATEKKHKVQIYHKLSHLITSGLFTEYEKYFSAMSCKYKNDLDLYSMLVYVNASRHTFVYDYREAKRLIKIAMTMANSSDLQNPCSFQVELLAALARIYVARKKFSKLQHVIDEAKMIVKSDPNRCKGVATGWLFFSDARCSLAKMAICSFRSTHHIDTYHWLKGQALDSLERAIGNFLVDLGDDGLFGLGCSICLMVITLLCCGENGMTMDVDILKPKRGDIDSAGQLLSCIESYKIPVSYALKALLMLAKCDYLFRQNHHEEAIECAAEVQTIAETCDMIEFVEQATVRLENLIRKTKCKIQDKCEEKQDDCFADMSETEISGY